MATKGEIQTKSRFEWDGRQYATSHVPARAAMLLDGLSHGGKRRVAIMGDYQTELARQNRSYTETTTWHYNEDGTLDASSADWNLRPATGAS